MGERVIEVLYTMRPDAWTSTAASLELYPDRPPEIVPIDITDETVTAVAGRISGGGGPGGTDSVSLQHWLLRFGEASGELRLIVGKFTEWLSNGRPPWATYLTMMSGRLIALDKQPGIRPIRIGETWRQLMGKCLI